MSYPATLPRTENGLTVIRTRRMTMIHKVALVIVAVVLASTVATAGQAPRVIIGRAQLGWVGTTSGPEVKCVGGQPADPTQYPYLPCSAGTTRAISRSEVQAWTAASASRSVAKLLAGPLTFVVNCDMNAQYRGPCWGTFEWEIPGIGTWAGFWTAPVMDLMTYESKMSMVGVGTGGEIDGKHLMLGGGSASGEYYVAMSVVVR
jgi:hypothetical protein